MKLLGNQYLFLFIIELIFFIKRWLSNSGQNRNQVNIHEQYKTEDAKIYYAPDQRDDFDDEDPDEDLNFQIKIKCLKKTHSNF